MSDNTQRQDIEKYEEFSFAHLQEKHPLGAELLGICALLATEDIPEELFIQGASVFGGNLQDITQSPHVWEQAIEDLLVYKLIERQASTHTLRISPSVQSTLLDVLSLDEQQRRVEQLLRALHSLVSSSSNTSLPQFVLHIQQIAKLSESWTLSFPEAAEVFSWAAKDLYEQKLYESAELLLKRALAIYTLVYGKTHLIVIMVLDDLVNLYKAQKNYTEAQRLLLRIFLSRMQVLGQEHPDTISTLCDMGDVYAIQGKREEAETLYKKALTNSELMLGSEHSIIVTVLDSLATLYLEWPDATNTEGNEKTNSSTETDG